MRSSLLPGSLSFHLSILQEPRATLERAWADSLPICSMEMVAPALHAQAICRQEPLLGTATFSRPLGHRDITTGPWYVGLPLLSHLGVLPPELMEHPLYHPLIASLGISFGSITKPSPVTHLILHSTPDLGEVTSPEFHRVPAGNQRPSQGRARHGYCRGHQVITIGLLGFWPMGKYRESCPGVDRFP